MKERRCRAIDLVYRADRRLLYKSGRESARSRVCCEVIKRGLVSRMIEEEKARFTGSKGRALARSGGLGERRSDNSLTSPYISEWLFGSLAGGPTETTTTGDVVYKTYTDATILV